MAGNRFHLQEHNGLQKAVEYNFVVTRVSVPRSKICFGLSKLISFSNGEMRRLPCLLKVLIRISCSSLCLTTMNLE